MRFKSDKMAPLWGAAGICASVLSGCGPKEQVVPAPADTVIVNNPTPAPGRIVVEQKPPQVIVKEGAKKTEGTSTTTETTTKTTSGSSDKTVESPPVRSENKTTVTVKTAPTKTPTPAKKEASLPEPAPAKDSGATKKLVTIPKDSTKLIVEDIKIGTGKRAEPGTNLNMIYTGTLTDGTVFDSNAESGQPFTFMLGSGQVIKGWDNGLVGMKVGGKRRLIIPPDMGYGDQGAPPKIPPGATLVFTVELKDVQ